MIFVTVGSQLPFDRLIRTVDRWALRSGRRDLFAQTGPGDPGDHPLQAMKWKPFLDPPTYRHCVATAEFVIAHAGMGSILAAVEARKPILVLPRLARYGEMRNDHQVGTARRLAQRGLVTAAFDARELEARLDAKEGFRIPEPPPPREHERLLATLRAFIAE